jgi:hypothetical protein
LNFKQIRPCLLHNFVCVSNGVVHHGDDRQPFQNGPPMHLSYAPAAWRVLSDSTGKWTISLILISQKWTELLGGTFGVCLSPPFATFVSIFFDRVSFVHPNCLFPKLA